VSTAIAVPAAARWSATSDRGNAAPGFAGRTDEIGQPRGVQHRIGVEDEQAPIAGSRPGRPDRQIQAGLPDRGDQGWAQPTGLAVQGHLDAGQRHHG